jgi:hypothetical protein
MRRSILIGIAIYILGFLTSVYLGNIFSNGDVNHSYFAASIFSVLYLSSIVAISASLILGEIRNNSKNQP